MTDTVASSPEASGAPAGAWDCHAHVFGPWSRFPLPPDPAYSPNEATFGDYRAMHARLGIAHGVLVQAAFYGKDHAALLYALEQSDGAYRGIATITPNFTDEQLQDMHAKGVRGARFNVVPHLPGSADPGFIAAVVERIRPLGWHVLVHGQLDSVLDLLPRATDLGVPVVIDHMARVVAANGIDYPAFHALETFVQLPNVWIKLSGADRIGNGLDYGNAAVVARRLLSLAPERALWGADWPHPNIAYPRPDEAQLLGLFRSVCDDDNLFRRVLVDNPQRLYA
jgi:2-pyrone-4,6-dicarboxylate lactonase